MLDKFISNTYEYVSQRKRVIIALIGLFTIVAIIGIFYISPENDIEYMLPENDMLRQSMKFLRESHLSNNIIISLSLNSDESSMNALTKATKTLSASLGPSLVTGVKNIGWDSNIMDEAASLLRYSPQLFNEEALEELKQKVVPAVVSERMGQIYRQMLTPSSAFIGPLMRADPLGVSLGVFHAFEKLLLSQGYDVTVKDGCLVSRDRRHAMIIAETPIVITDAFGARKLIDYLRRHIDSLPDFISADIIAGHLHAIDNEDALKRDVRLVAVTVSVAFLILFIYIFRDFSAITIFLMPLASVLIAIYASMLLFKTVSYFIIGMGAVIAGIAIDYGIHVYSAVRVSEGRPDSVKHIARPVIAGALTTGGIFIAFLFSRIPGYRQLAFFSLSSISICLLYSLFVLPHILSDRRSRAFESAVRFIHFGRKDTANIFVLCCWTILMLAAIASSFRTTFNSDIRQYDAARQETLNAEEEFHRVWGGDEAPAIFVTTSNTLEGAVMRNEEIYKEAIEAVGSENFSSIALVWPSIETRQTNLLRWKYFWSVDRIAEVKELFNKYGADYDFSDDAFKPFFDIVDNPDSVREDISAQATILAHIKERFIHKRGDSYQIFSFFPDDDHYIRALSPIAELHSDTFLVSRKSLSHLLSQSVSSEIIPLTIGACLMILTLTFLFLRSVYLVAVALIPVLTGVVAITGLMSLLGISLDVSALTAMLIVCGLCIDYGIFMVYSCRHSGVETATSAAVVLSAFTTLIGSGALLFARHPVLLSIGRTLTIGVFAGCVVSLLIVPSAYALVVGRPKPKWMLL